LTIYHPHRIEASSVTSVDGTFRTWRNVRFESAFGGKAENICSH
jgi:hypothetical protein